MASINTANIDPAVKKVLQDMLSDLTALRTAHAALTAKLDLDVTVTDADYAALTDPPALKTAK
jgi:hypothetical protein